MIDEKKLLKLVGSNLRRLRKEKNMTQAELANAIGVHRSYLSTAENGKANITVILLFKILSEVGYGIFLVEDKKVEEVIKVLGHFSSLTILK